MKLFVENMNRQLNMEFPFGDMVDAYPIEDFLTSEKGRKLLRNERLAWKLVERAQHECALDPNKFNLFFRRYALYHKVYRKILNAYLKAHPYSFFFMSHTMRNLYTSSPTTEIKKDAEQNPFLFPELEFQEPIPNPTTGIQIL